MNSRFLWAALAALTLSLPAAAEKFDLKSYKATEGDLRELRDKGMGHAEIAHALAIAQKADKPLAEIVSLRESGLTWGQVAKQNGFKVTTIRGQLRGLAAWLRDSENSQLRDAPRETASGEVLSDDISLGDIDRRHGDDLAREFDVEGSDVRGLRDDGFSWGEVRQALAISRKAEVPLSEIRGLLDSGIGWNEIAKKYGFTLGDVSNPRSPAATDSEQLTPGRTVPAPGSGSAAPASPSPTYPQSGSEGALSPGAGASGGIQGGPRP